MTIFAGPVFCRLQIGYCLALSFCCCCWAIIKNQLARILLFLEPTPGHYNPTVLQPSGAARQPKYKMATQQSPYTNCPLAASL